MWPKHVKTQARQLRSEGKSFNEIARILEVPRGNIVRWVTGVHLSVEAKEIGTENWRKGIEKIKSLREARWRRFREEADTQWQSLRLDPEFMLGLGIYAGEGSKTSPNSAKVTNCSAPILLIAMRFFGRIGVPTEMLNAHVYVYREEDVVPAEKYWSKTLGVARSRFFKTSVFAPRIKSDRRGRRHLFGICNIELHNTQYRQMIGRWLELALGGQ